MANSDGDRGTAVAPPATYADLARMIDWPLVAPELAPEEAARLARHAATCGVGRVTVRPCDLEAASLWGVPIAAVISYPHGADTTAVKVYATRDALARGAQAIETVLSPARMQARQFRHLESELSQIAAECHRAGAELVVSLELGWLAEDLQLIARRIASRSEVDCVRPTSLYGPAVATEVTIALAQKLQDRVKVAVQLDPAATLDEVLALHAAGVVGFQIAGPEALLSQWSAELKRRAEVEKN